MRKYLPKHDMHRRQVLNSSLILGLGWAAGVFPALSGQPFRRVRPGDPNWPKARSWENLRREVGGNLFQPQALLAVCGSEPEGTACRDVINNLTNPYYIGDQPAGTQVSGWLDAWMSAPSAYAVAAHRTADVVAAINFARLHNLRLVVKGGGHSYQGTSNAPDSLLVWTRAMKEVTLHDRFVGQGCEGVQEPVPAATIEAGAMWMDAYDAITTHGGRYVQGGGCATVGVAGLVQSGGFGSFSKGYGTAAAGLLEAEVVTADGTVRITNACNAADLFWALKGGGGGSWGVVTRVTLRTHELPNWFGSAEGEIRASSDVAFRALIGRFVSFYRDSLFSPHWGETISLHRSNTLRISMESQGLDKERIATTWQPFFDWVTRSPNDYTILSPLKTNCVPARHYWDARYLRAIGDTSYVSDQRPGVPEAHIWWTGDNAQVGEFCQAYQSTWLPASLLEDGQQGVLADALFASSRAWSVGLHFNKGLAGAPPPALAAAKNTATNPAVLSAFALAIISAGGSPAYPGLPASTPDLAIGRAKAANVTRAMSELRKIASAGSYVSESDYFEPFWQRSFWGDNYSRLRAIRAKYDPAGLFFVHHGVGSEDWSDDGFGRVR
jgi:FAD/FMN-containing dehydrogenase